ncbi:MAG: hypothetical protein V3U43_07830, partial [Pseudomonadales bacterium]
YTMPRSDLTVAYAPSAYPAMPVDLTGHCLCFRFERGVSGLWIGMLVGLATVDVVLLAVWVRRMKRWPLD